VHHVAFLIEAHSLDRQKIRQVEVAKGCGFTEDVVNNFVLYHFEIDHSRNQRKCRLVLFVKWLYFE